MKTLIYYILIAFCMFSCKEKQADKLILNQPINLSVDTTLRFFPLVKKYIQEINKRDNGVTHFILAFYYHENVEELRIKITAIKTFESFNGRLPNYYFKYKNNLIFVFTGIDMISKFDPIYIKNIKSQFQDNRLSIYDPGCWEIVFNKDTCYYYHSKYPLIPVVKGPKFEGPPYKHSLSQ